MYRNVRRFVWTMLVAAIATPTVTAAQTSRGSQRIDEEYTRLIAEHLQDDRITTELVDHLPASETVPTPLDFHGRIVGTPDELTYAADIHRYLRAIADASPRATVMSMGQTEEGREMIVMAIADEATIASLETYKGYLQELTDPRRTPEDRARRLIEEMAKPIYWLTSGIHSTENGGPEMLQELAYRLVVQDSDFISTIRDNIITFITPVIEVDGREKQVLEGAATAGVHSVQWDMQRRLEGSEAERESLREAAGRGGRGGGGFGGRGGPSPAERMRFAFSDAPAGEYRVVLSVDGQSFERRVTILNDDWWADRR